MKIGTRKELKEKLGGKTMFEKHDCPFCVDIDNPERVLWRSENWAIIYNVFPYILSGQHLMLIPVKHRKFLYELTENEFYGLKEAHKFLKDFFGKESYFSFSRDSFAERSVEHFHTHFMPGRLRRKSLVTMLGEQGFEINPE